MALAAGATALGLEWTMIDGGPADRGDRRLGDAVVFCGDALLRVPLPPGGIPHVGVFVGRAGDAVVTFLRGGGSGALRWPWNPEHTPALIAQVVGLPPGDLPPLLQPRRRA